MDFDYTPQEQSFREEVRGFIAEHLPPKEERDKNFLATWLEKVRAKGWLALRGRRNSAAAMAGSLSRPFLKKRCPWLRHHRWAPR